MPGLAERAGKFLLLRLPNAQESASDVGRTDREHPLFWSGPELEDVRFVVRAPQGYRVYALGKGVAAKGGGWSVKAAFSPHPKQPAVVRFRDLWERTALDAPTDAYKTYREALIRRSRLRNEVIVFVKQ